MRQWRVLCFAPIILALLAVLSRRSGGDGGGSSLRFAVVVLDRPRIDAWPPPPPYDAAADWLAPAWRPFGNRTLACARVATDPRRPGATECACLGEFFLIGFPKCGSTSLAHHLFSHPRLANHRARAVGYRGNGTRLAAEDALVFLAGDRDARATAESYFAHARARELWPPSLCARALQVYTGLPSWC